MNYEHKYIRSDYMFLGNKYILDRCEKCEHNILNVNLDKISNIHLDIFVENLVWKLSSKVLIRSKDETYAIVENNIFAEHYKLQRKGKWNFKQFFKGACDISDEDFLIKQIIK